MNESIYKNIKSLPLLDNTVIKIQRICNDSDSNISQLANVIKQDPMLTTNILRSANSPLYGFSREIKDISRACSLFGMATIRGFALYGAVKNTFDMDLSPYNITNNDFLNIATNQSHLIFSWYPKVDQSLMPILSPASFIMEIGRVLVARELIEKKLSTKFKERLKEIDNVDDLAKLEEEFIGVTSEFVTAKIFEQWNLESEMSEAIMYSNDPNKAPEHIRPYSIALKITKNAVNNFGILSEKNIENALALFDEFGLDKNLFLNSIEKK